MKVKSKVKAGTIPEGTGIGGYQGMGTSEVWYENLGPDAYLC
jgi:hypothetical protein